MVISQQEPPLEHYNIALSYYIIIIVTLQSSCRYCLTVQLLLLLLLFLFFKVLANVNSKSSG